MTSKTFTFSLVAVVILAATTIFLLHKTILIKLQCFLSVTKPVAGEVLIVEGWISPPALIEAAAAFNNGNYRYCLITGNEEDLPASVKCIGDAGVSPGYIRRAVVHHPTGHNTFAMAQAAKTWLENHDPSIKKVDVFTTSVHGRKSWVIFKRVFGGDYTLGILSSDAWHFNIDSWWKSRKGIKNVVKNFTGYIYGMLWHF